MAGLPLTRMSMTGKNRVVDGSVTVRVVIRSLLDELGLRSKISLNFHSIKLIFDSTQAKNIRIGSKPIFFFLQTGIIIIIGFLLYKCILRLAFPVFSFLYLTTSLLFFIAWTCSCFFIWRFN